jgi:hypothetical protein
MLTVMRTIIPGAGTQRSEAVAYHCGARATPRRRRRAGSRSIGLVDISCRLDEVLKYRESEAQLRPNSRRRARLGLFGSDRIGSDRVCPARTACSMRSPSSSSTFFQYWNVRWSTGSETLLLRCPAMGFCGGGNAHAINIRRPAGPCR